MKPKQPPKDYPKGKPHPEPRFVQPSEYANRRGPRISDPALDGNSRIGSAKTKPHKGTA